MIAWMFPGQGSQRPGMAAELEACKDLFQRAKAIVPADLERICTSPANTKWPADLLQPAIFTTSVGAAMAIQARGLSPDAVVGHSLGEYAALVVAEVLSFEDALRLVTARGRGMAAAGKRNPGGMAAVIGLDPEKIEKICADIGAVWVANFNSPSQTVISGRDEALGRAAEECRTQGAMKVIRLEVPMAAHTPLMDSAADELRAAIETVEFAGPGSTWFSVADGDSHNDIGEIKELLVRAVISSVRFLETVKAMHAAGVNDFVEVGPGRALRGLVKQNLDEVNLAGVGADGEVEALVFGMQRGSKQ